MRAPIVLVLATVLIATIRTGTAAAEDVVNHEKIRQDRINVLLPQIMKEQKVDAWLTFTRENTTDPILAVLGVDHIVARGAFIFARKDGAFRRIAIAASYDVDPIEKSGLYAR